jgi:chromosome segregation ATPase
MGGTDEQVLTGSSENYQGGSGSVTMLQVNRQELLQLLNNFQKAVDKSGQSMTDEVSSLKSSLSTINASDAQLSGVIESKLQQVNSQIDSINQKFDTYNKAITGVQSALEQTQQQLKLILAQRAEDIDHYTLRAIVSGRAWLVDGEGRTVTVILGQDLKNYGTVQEINDKMGYVTMSSGFVFK